MILAGGFGSRLSEETTTRPKPMVEIGGKPMLWHIMKMYAAYGIEEFVICLGYKGYLIKEYFANYYLHTCDVSFDLARGAMEVHRSTTEPWKVTLVDTGDGTMTGGRLKRVLPYIGENEFCFTYGDGVTDVDLAELLAFHRDQGKIATVTAVQPPGRYSAIRIEGSLARSFEEKPDGDGAWMNGGFLYSLRRSAATWRGMKRCGSKSRCGRWQARGSSSASLMKGSGRQWTRCVIATSCSGCGSLAVHHGGSGSERRRRSLGGANPDDARGAPRRGRPGIFGLSSRFGGDPPHPVAANPLLPTHFRRQREHHKLRASAGPPCMPHAAGHPWPPGDQLSRVHLLRQARRTRRHHRGTRGPCSHGRATKACAESSGGGARTVKRLQ